MPKRVTVDEPIEQPEVDLYDLFFDKWGFIRKVEDAHKRHERMSIETDIDMSDYEN